MLLAQARTGGWPGPIRPRTHLMLRVWIDDQPWLADVGFGFGGAPGIRLVRTLLSTLQGFKAL